MKDSKKRTMVKAVTFRIIATIATVILVFLVTRDFAIAGIFGVFDIFAKLFIYYVHERFWENVAWGRLTEE